MYIKIQTFVYPCSLGQVLVANIPDLDNKLCALELGNDPIAMLHNYQSRFNKEYVRWKEESHDSSLLEKVLLAVEKSIIHPELYTYESGTKFQRDIWSIIKKIPLGETWSYKKVAEEYGNPDASRAVANACGANSLAIVIPCHRVIASSGSSGGYRWGEDIKKKLLQREKNLSS